MFLKIRLVIGKCLAFACCIISFMGGMFFSHFLFSDNFERLLSTQRSMRINELISTSKSLVFYRDKHRDLSFLVNALDEEISSMKYIMMDNSRKNKMKKAITCLKNTKTGEKNDKK